MQFESVTTMMQVEEGGRDVDLLHAKIMQMKTAEAVAARQVQEQRSLEDAASKDALRLANDKLMDSQQQVRAFASQPLSEWHVTCDIVSRSDLWKGHSGNRLTRSSSFALTCIALRSRPLPTKCRLLNIYNGCRQCTQRR